MKLILVAVGQKMPAWVETGFEEYRKRMPREAALHLLEIRAEKRSAGKTAEQVMAAERDRILDAIPPRAALWVLDEHGHQPDSVELSRYMNEALHGGQDICLIIGGADGLHADVKARAARLLSLSRLTLPHALVRVLIAEQLFRALSILNNHPYHRE